MQSPMSQYTQATVSSLHPDTCPDATAQKTSLERPFARCATDDVLAKPNSVCFDNIFNLFRERSILLTYFNLFTLFLKIGVNLHP